MCTKGSVKQHSYIWSKGIHSTVVARLIWVWSGHTSVRKAASLHRIMESKCSTRLYLVPEAVFGKPNQESSETHSGRGVSADFILHQGGEKNNGSSTILSASKPNPHDCCAVLARTRLAPCSPPQLSSACDTFTSVLWKIQLISPTIGFSVKKTRLNSKDQMKLYLN